MGKFKDNKIYFFLFFKYANEVPAKGTNSRPTYTEPNRKTTITNKNHDQQKLI